MKKIISKSTTYLLLPLFFLALVSIFSISNLSAMNEENERIFIRKTLFGNKYVEKDQLEEIVLEEQNVKFDKYRKMYYLGNSLDSPDLEEMEGISSKEVECDDEDDDGLEEGLQKLLEARDSTNDILKDLKKVKRHEALMRDKDRRIQITDPTHVPHLWHGQLIMDFGGNTKYIGSGTLIDKRIVLTAAHNLYDRKTKRRAVEVTFYAGKEGPSAVAIGKSEALEFPEEWTLDGNHNIHDLGIVVLSKEFEKKFVEKNLSHIGIGSLTDDSLKGKTFNILGYPGAAFVNKALKLINGDYMFGHAGPHLPDLSTDDSLIHYDIDTSPGQSGSSVWFQNDDGDFICCAVHVRGGPKGHNYNVGTRINEEKFAKISQWLDTHTKDKGDVI